MRSGEEEYFTQQVKFFEAVRPRPFCTGCPDGVFEKAALDWLDGLAAQLAADTGDRWGTCAPLGLVEAAPRHSMGDGRATQPLDVRYLTIVDAPEVGPRTKKLVLGDKTWLSAISVVKWATPKNITGPGDVAYVPMPDTPPPPRPSVEIQLEALRQELLSERQQRTVQYGTLTRMLQRLTVLCVHYGTAPLDVELTLPLFGVVKVTLRKPVDIPDTERDPRGQDVGQKRPV